MKKLVATVANQKIAGRFLALAVLTVLVLGLAPTASIKAQARPFVCPVTKPTPVQFERVGHWANSSHTNLLGTEKLFTMFPWNAAQKTDHGYRIPKIVWGSNVVDLHDEVRHSTLTITGRRLDQKLGAESGGLLSWGASTAWLDPASGKSGTPTPIDKIDKNEFAITSEFVVPTLGCWEVTGHFHGEDLKVVIDVK